MNLGYFLILGGVFFIILSNSKSKTAAAPDLPAPFPERVTMARPTSHFQRLN